MGLATLVAIYQAAGGLGFGACGCSRCGRARRAVAVAFARRAVAAAFWGPR